MSVWIGPGRRTLDAVWQDPIEGMRIAAVLSELGWGGWKSMVLPHVLRSRPETLTTSPTQTLSILTHLYSAGKLDVDPVWVARVGSEVFEMLENWGVEDDITNLLNILALAPMLPNAVSGVSRVVGLLHTQGEKDVKRLDVGLVEMIEKWSWSQSVMDALVEIQPLLDPVPLDTLLRHLLTPLTPHSRVLRSSVLQILSGPSLSSRSSEQADVLARLAAAESIPLTVRSVRERVVKTGKITAGGMGGMQGVVVRWLVAQLKINLRPLWAPATQNLGIFAGEVVWDIVFGELERVCKEPGSFALRAPGEGEKMDIDEGEGKAEWREEEKT